MAARDVAAARRPSPSRHYHTRWIRNGRIQQLDLYPDDRPQPRLLGSGRKSDHAVEAAVIRDRQPGQPELDGALDQLIRGGSAVQE